MKKVKRLFSVVAFSIFLCASYPVMAQNDNAASTTQTSDEGDDDSGKWDWLACRPEPFACRPNDRLRNFFVRNLIVSKVKSPGLLRGLFTTTTYQLC